MADIDDTSLGLAIDHVRAINSIHAILTGIEWDAGTIENVAEVIEDLGYDIKDPTEYENENALAEEVLKWASTPGNHGGNPYAHQFVKTAERIVRKAEMTVARDT